jgi:hypothetical protein
MLDRIKKITCILVCSLGTLLSIGCEKNESLSDLSSPAYITHPKQVDFAIAGCHIYYKGKELPQFTGTKADQAPTIQSWIDVLGNDYVNFDANIFVWKELGFRVFTRRDDKSKVQTLTIMKYVPAPKYIELENDANNPELLEDMRKFYGDNRYEKNLPQRITDARNEITIYSRIPHPKPIWFNGAIIENHFNKELFNQQLAQYRQKLHDGYESPWGQGSGSQFFEGYTYWVKSSFSKCEGDWGFESSILIKQEFAPDDVIGDISIGPDR